MLLKNWIKDYLSFGKRDRIGIIALLVLILLIYFLPIIFVKKRPSPLQPGSVLAAAMDSVSAREVGKKESEEQSKSEGGRSWERQSSARAFRFNPNTLSAAGWQKLGLREKTIQTIQKYLSKGGKFYKQEDLARIWGLPPGFYERVKDSIFIENAAPVSTYFERAPEHRTAKPAVININEADTTSLIALPGIGPKLASRIIAFRNKLGGFYDVMQVGETFGLNDSTFQKIKLFLTISGDVVKLNINVATKEELKVHPYIRWNLANAIISYREQHGNFKSVEELKNISAIDEAMYEKIRHYVRL